MPLDEYCKNLENMIQYLLVIIIITTLTIFQSDVSLLSFLLIKISLIFIFILSIFSTTYYIALACLFLIYTWIHDSLSIVYKRNIMVINKKWTELYSLILYLLQLSIKEYLIKHFWSSSVRSHPSIIISFVLDWERFYACKVSWFLIFQL